MAKTLAERATEIGQRAALHPQEERQLGALLDRSMAEANDHKSRSWYSVTYPDGTSVGVHFNPAQTIEEAQRWYPGCKVDA